MNNDALFEDADKNHAFPFLSDEQQKISQDHIILDALFFCSQVFSFAHSREDYVVTKEIIWFYYNRTASKYTLCHQSGCRSRLVFPVSIQFA